MLTKLRELPQRIFTVVLRFLPSMSHGVPSTNSSSTCFGSWVPSMLTLMLVFFDYKSLSEWWITYQKKEWRKQAFITCFENWWDQPKFIGHPTWIISRRTLWIYMLIQNFWFIRQEDGCAIQSRFTLDSQKLRRTLVHFIISGQDPDFIACEEIGWWILHPYISYEYSAIVSNFVVIAKNSTQSKEPSNSINISEKK